MTVQQPLEKVDGGAPGKSSQQQAPVAPPNAQQPEPNVQHSSMQRQPSQKLAIKWPPTSESSQADASPRGPSKEFPAAGHKEVNILFSRSTSGRLSEGQGGEPSKTPSSASDGQVKSAGNGHANPGPTSNLAKPDISQNTSVSKANQTHRILSGRSAVKVGGEWSVIYMLIMMLHMSHDRALSKTQL